MLEVGGVAAKNVVASCKTFRIVFKKKCALASRNNHSGGCFSSVVGSHCPGCARSLGSIHGGVGIGQGERFDFWERKCLLYSVWAFQSGNK